MISDPDAQSRSPDSRNPLFRSQLSKVVRPISQLNIELNQHDLPGHKDMLNNCTTIDEVSSIQVSRRVNGRNIVSAG